MERNKAEHKRTRGILESAGISTPLSTPEVGHDRVLKVIFCFAKKSPRPCISIFRISTFHFTKSPFYESGRYRTPMKSRSEYRHRPLLHRNMPFAAPSTICHLLHALSTAALATPVIIVTPCFLFGRSRFVTGTLSLFERGIWFSVRPDRASWTAGVKKT